MTRSHVKHRAGGERTSRVRLRLIAAVAVALISCGGSQAVAAPEVVAAVVPAATVSTPDLVVNGTFSAGTSGWFSSGKGVPLVTFSSASTGPHARLAPSSTATAVLNDTVNTVAVAPSGTTYRVSASVRALKPNVSGALRVREVVFGSAVVHSQSFALRSTSWTTVTYTFTTSRQGASLDLNVLAWNMAKGQSLDVDNVSLVKVAAGSAAPAPAPSPTPAPAPSPTPTPVPSQTPTPVPSPTATPTPKPTSTPAPVAPVVPGGTCNSAVPTKTIFGASLSWDGRTPAAALAELDAQFGHNLEVLRLFDAGLPASWSSARASATADRTVVVSFRPMPQDVLAGKYDAQLKAFFSEAPAGQTIYWSYIHEPEPLIDNGTFTADQYRKAWQRISGFADAACKPKMHATLILTGWTADPGSKRSVSTYYAGDSVIDVIAWDPYNGVHDPTRNYYASAEEMFANVVAVSKSVGKPFGIAETGSRLIPGDSGAGRAAWLTSIGTYLEKSGAVFVSYFNSTRDANWVLEDAPSQHAWGALVAR